MTSSYAKMAPPLADGAKRLAKNKHVIFKWLDSHLEPLKSSGGAETNGGRASAGRLGRKR